MRPFLLGLLLLAAPAWVAPLAAQDRRPNILLVMTDDQGWGDVYSHGNSKIDTPTMDRLATEGARFDRFFVSPVCAPTRASLLTGRYHLRTGVSGVTRGLETMRPEEVTLAEMFRDAGYATGLFGKWHNGAHYPSDPAGQGFEAFLGFSAGHWNNYFNTTLEQDGAPVETEGYITDVLTEAALAFITQRRDRPFFCYVPYNAPHSPFQVPDRYFDKYKARGLDDKTAAAYGMVENADDNLARLLARLDSLGLTQHTIVVFLTDNGPNGDRFNGGMKGVKGSVHEGGVRVPFFIRWPGRIPRGRTIRTPAAHIDVLPTLAALAGVALPAGRPLDGRDLAPLWQDPAAAWPDRMLFHHHSRRDSLERYPGAVRTARHRAVRYGEAWELYDMLLDPGQTTDLAAAQPAVVEPLAAAYEAWYDEVTRGALGRPAIPVGYAARPLVELPAPEAYLGGAVRYFGKSGWANDWLTGWQRGADRAWWELDVVEAGRYEVSALYTATRPGARLRLEVGGQVIEGAIERGHDPAPLPSPDRVARGEVYEKVWAALDFGALALPRGRTRLTLAPAAFSADQAFDIKAVRLRRVGP